MDSIRIVVHTSPSESPRSDACNPFDINVPIEDVVKSLEHEGLETDINSPDTIPASANVASDQDSSPTQSGRVLRNSLTPPDDEEEHLPEIEETLVTNTHEIVTPKTRTLEEDKNDNMLHDRSVEITRGKGLQLKEEEVTLGVYKKKCGFRTLRPIEWAAALEGLLTEYRWDYAEQENKYTQCLIKVANGSGMITIEIKLTTGLVFAYGYGYEDWFCTFFEPWRSLVVDGVRIPISTPPPQTEHKESPLTIDDINTNVERLWNEHNSLKTAFVTMDTTVSNLSSEIQDLVSAVRELKSS